MSREHELWAAAQLAPGEGIEDGVARIAAILRLAAPQPEPVALMALHDINELMHCNGMSVFVENPRIYPPYCEGEPLVGFVPLYAAPPAAPANRLTLNYAQAVQLMVMYADDADCEITLSSGEGHSGPGIYAHYSEYPEEGAQLLDPSEKVAPHAAAPTPAVPLTDNDCTPNHFCNRRFVHLPRGEQCDRCGHE